MRRLTKDEHLSVEFASTWPQYDLDAKTHALLAYAKKLTQEPSMVEDSDIEELRSAGWDEQGIYEATADGPVAGGPRDRVGGRCGRSRVLSAYRAVRVTWSLTHMRLL